MCSNNQSLPDLVAAHVASFNRSPTRKHQFSRSLLAHLSPPDLFRQPAAAGYPLEPCAVVFGDGIDFMKDWRKDFEERWEKKSSDSRRERREEWTLRIAIIAIVIAIISAHNDIRWLISCALSWFKK
jgi:hypothetical protein